MNLEQRVETLEQELQVLKSQIQATLLDLQEFMLTNSYPTLRADGEAAPSQPAPAPVSPQPAPAHPAEPAVERTEPHATSPRRQMSTHEYADVPSSQAQQLCNDAQVRVNKIASVDQIVRQQRREAYDEPVYEEMDAPANARRIDNYDEPMNTRRLDSYDEPVSTRRIDRYDEPARLPSTRRNGHLHRQPSQNEPGWFDQDQDDPDDDYPRELQGWVPPFLTGSSNGTDSIPHADWANLYMLEEWVQQRIESMGASRTRLLIKRYSDEGRIDPLLRVMMLQLVSIITEQQDTLAADGTHNPQDEHTGDVTHDMVLKMIARLQNTGLTWRKNHG